MGKLIPMDAIKKKESDALDLAFVRKNGCRIDGIKKLLTDCWYGYAIPVDDPDNAMPGGLLIYVPFSGGTKHAKAIIEEAE